MTEPKIVQDMDVEVLKKASFYVEDLKDMVGSGALEGVTAEQLNAQLYKLLCDAGFEDVSAADLQGDLDGLAANFAAHLRQVGIRIYPGLVTSFILDGFMHGLAMGAKLEGKEREIDGDT